MTGDPLLAALNPAHQQLLPRPNFFDDVKMRRRERDEEVAKRSAPRQLAFAQVAKANDVATAKGGAEAFVAKGKENYGQPDWESDETLEAYLSA